MRTSVYHIDQNVILVVEDGNTNHIDDLPELVTNIIT